MSESNSETVESPAKPARPVFWSVIGTLSILAFIGLCIVLMNFGSIGAPSVSIDPNRVADLQHGQKIYNVSCATCHGAGGKGMPHQGAPIDHRSAFVAGSTDLQLIQMIKIGRGIDDPRSVLKLPMPAKGGYNNLTDTDLHDVVAYIRTFVPKPDATADTTQVSEASK